jgi:hypothetical protein
VHGHPFRTVLLCSCALLIAVVTKLFADAKKPSNEQDTPVQRRGVHDVQLDDVAPLLRYPAVRAAFTAAMSGGTKAGTLQLGSASAALESCICHASADAEADQSTAALVGALAGRTATVRVPLEPGRGQSAVDVVVRDLPSEPETSKVVGALLEGGDIASTWLTAVEVRARQLLGLSPGSGLTREEVCYAAAAATAPDLEAEWKAPRFDAHDAVHVRVLECESPPKSVEGRQLANFVWRGVCRANELHWRREAVAHFIFVDADKGLNLDSIFSRGCTAKGAPQVKQLWLELMIDALSKRLPDHTSAGGTLEVSKPGRAHFFLLAWDRELLLRAHDVASMILRRANCAVSVKAALSISRPLRPTASPAAPPQQKTEQLMEAYSRILHADHPRGYVRA